MFAEAIGRTKNKNTQVIGLAPWMLVHNSMVLIQTRQKINVPTYYVHRELEIEKNVPGARPKYLLDQNHTHFFLVDTVGDHPKKKAIRFKNKFQGFVRNLSSWMINRNSKNH